MAKTGLRMQISGSCKAQPFLSGSAAAGLAGITFTDDRVAGDTLSTSYTAANFHDLVDMPTFVGRFDYDSARVSNTWIRFATYPAGGVTGTVREGIWRQFQRMIPPQVSVFGEVPWGPHYTILQVTDSSSGASNSSSTQNGLGFTW